MSNEFDLVKYRAKQWFDLGISLSDDGKLYFGNDEYPLFDPEDHDRETLPTPSDEDLVKIAEVEIAKWQAFRAKYVAKEPL